MNASVVELIDLEHGVLQLTMQDRAHRNTFSNELTGGLIDAFAAIDTHTDCRVVILSGYDSYFASGGTQEGLLAMQAGTSRFTSSNLYRLALDCRVPVIAAMQGHGIGGGFVFGLFADFVVLSRESVYTTNFMKYGFTPGMGATCIVPRKLGIALGQEMLIAARNYRGVELERRGIAFPVLPRAEVLEYARDLARDVAHKPRAALIALKDHLVADLRRELVEVADQEVALHEATFHAPDVRDRISTLFGN